MGLWCVSCFVLAPEGTAQCVTCLLIHTYAKRGLIWIVYIAPLASLASLARCARSTTEAQFGISWRARNLIQQIKNNRYNRQTFHRLCIPIVYSSIALLGLVHHLGSSCTVLYRLGAILGSLDAVLNASRLPKTFPRSFHKALPIH